MSTPDKAEQVLSRFRTACTLITDASRSTDAKSMAYAIACWSGAEEALHKLVAEMAKCPRCGT